MRHDLAERLRMVYNRDDGQELGGSRRTMTWRHFILALGLHTTEEIAEDGFGAYWDFLRGTPSYTYTKDPVRRLCHRLISYSISGRGQAPEKVTATDLFYLCSIDRGAANVPYLLVKCLFGHAEGRKSGVRLSGGHFFRRHAHHFGLVSDDGLRGLSVVARELPLIDMGKPIKLNICMDIGDDWAWVALGPKRQPDAAANAPRAAEDAHVVDEGAQADPAPLHQLRLMKASGQTYQAFDRTFRGSSPPVFEKCTKQRTDGANTSIAP
ncbi:hypothetical protein Tco_0084867 [Tanacetum coccineum]